MSAAIETPAQFERDLRSASKEWKRAKDSSAKWSFGVRPNRAHKGNGLHVETEKPRPMGKQSDACSYNKKSHKLEHNVVKMRPDWNMPASRVRSKISAAEEIRDTSRSISDLLPGASPLHARKMSVSDNVLYSFDQRETTPGKPLALDIFVKTTGRETERFVEKEYEILDGNGTALKGRKARRHLRKSAADSPSGGLDAEEAEEVDGFELV